MKLDLSKAFDHSDPKEGQKVFEKLMTPEIHHQLAKHVSNHLLGKMPKETGMAFYNQTGGASTQSPAFPPSTPVKKIPKAKKSLDDQGWRSSPFAQSGEPTETGSDTGLP